MIKIYVYLSIDWLLCGCVWIMEVWAKSAFTLQTLQSLQSDNPSFIVQNTQTNNSHMRISNKGAYSNWIKQKTHDLLCEFWKFSKSIDFLSVGYTSHKTCRDKIDSFLTIFDLLLINDLSSSYCYSVPFLHFMVD